MLWLEIVVGQVTARKAFSILFDIGDNFRDPIPVTIHRCSAFRRCQQAAGADPAQDYTQLLLVKPESVILTLIDNDAAAWTVISPMHDYIAAGAFPI